MPYVDSRSGNRIVKRKMIVIPCRNNIIEVQSNQSLLCRVINYYSAEIAPLRGGFVNRCCAEL